MTDVKLIIDAGEFAVKASNVAMFAAPEKDARPILVSVMFKKHGEGVRIVATDSYGLAFDVLDGVECDDEQACWLVPAKLVAEAAKLAGKLQPEFPVIMIAEGDQVRFDIAGRSISDRLVDGAFPNWEQLVPGDEKLTGCPKFGVATKMLARLAKIKAGTDCGTGYVLSIQTQDPLKPFVVKVGSLTVLQMTVRLAS